MSSNPPQPDETPTPQQPQQSLSMLSARLGPLSLRAWIFILLVMIVGLMYYKQLPPDITNAQYIQKLLDKGTLARTAGALIRDARPEPTGDDAARAAEESKWTGIANDLAACLENKAQAYLESGDPYLARHFDRETPHVVSTRLLTDCDAIKYLPKEKK